MKIKSCSEGHVGVKHRGDWILYDPRTDSYKVTPFTPPGASGAPRTIVIPADLLDALHNHAWEGEK